MFIKIMPFFRVNCFTTPQFSKDKFLEILRIILRILHENKVSITNISQMLTANYPNIRSFLKKMFT